MTDPIERAVTEAKEIMNHAADLILRMKNDIERLREDRAELRRALYETAYCLNSLDVTPSAMTKTTADTLIRLNLGGFND
jgi:hypothetical protein